LNLTARFSLLKTSVVSCTKQLHVDVDMQLFNEYKIGIFFIKHNNLTELCSIISHEIQLYTFTVYSVPSFKLSSKFRDQRCLTVTSCVNWSGFRKSFRSRRKVPIFCPPRKSGHQWCRLHGARAPPPCLQMAGHGGGHSE